MAEVKKATAKVIAKAPVKEEVQKVEAVQAEVKKAPAKKTAVSKKETAKKAPVKASAKKAVANKVAVGESVHFEFSGKSYTPEDLLKICKDVWKYDLNGEEEDFKSVELYVKPEENATYYVINGDITGSFFI